jgi:hypothetical protein
MITLTPDFTIVDCQTTPSGYYLIRFRSKATGHTVTATQHGNGGSVLYSPRDWEEELFTWLGKNSAIAVNHMRRLGYPELAVDILTKEGEWEDTVVLSIVDLIEMGEVRITG